MRRMKFYILFAIAAGLICPVDSVSQFPVHINSGNPAFPFPQFLPYVHPNNDTLHNVGTLALSRDPAARVAAAGVTHAEMEKSIRDAYQIMMNRAQHRTLNGLTGVGGTRYVWFESDPICAEGDAYAMIAAAMMGDKVTFDGLWLHAHDWRMPRTVRYGDGVTNSPNYFYTALPRDHRGAPDSEDSAGDADFDFALALMIAHMQWGEFMGINDSRGNPISYKADFIKILRGITDTMTNRQALPDIELVTGSIGFDGYIRSGNTWPEMTNWAANPANLRSIGINSTNRVYQPSGDDVFVDYSAPAYFRQFADYLKQEDAGRYAWNIQQFERGEASSDWIMGMHIAENPRNIPYAGSVIITNGVPVSRSTGDEGEDFRWAWRNILNYVWHGNPQNSWDPTTNKLSAAPRPNTYQRDAGLRYARFLWDRRQAPWTPAGDGCETIIGEGRWWGPSMLKNNYTHDGNVTGTFMLNWIHGVGSPSAVTSQDFNLMAEMYRQAEITWDNQLEGDGYITGKPKYFHGFFRLLGMHILTGNHQSPLNMKRQSTQANMKVYLDVDKTYAFENDTITYTIDYRNYGSVNAQNVVITNRLHSDFVFVPTTGAGSGTYDPSSHSVRWNIGTVPGFRSATGVSPTQGSVQLKVVIPNANHKRYENHSFVTITCSNGTGWTANEYPNKISSVMKRNGVDIVRRALRVNKKVVLDTVNPGMTATYTVNIENSSEAGWLNGGRPGVNFTYAHANTPAMATEHKFMIRAYHDAHEAYIDYGNYRISYFMFHSSYSGVYHPVNDPNGDWDAPADYVAPMALTNDVRDGLRHEMFPPGQDEKGRWNQRLILQLGNPQDPNRSDTNWATMSAPTQFITSYRGGLDTYIHRGVAEPFRITWRMNARYRGNISWSDDWSFNTRAAGVVDSDLWVNWGHPISPDFTESSDPDYPGKRVGPRHRKLCEPDAAFTVDNILIEEWDGYTWRRVFGNGPVPGREVTNVVVTDTVPRGVTFLRFLEPFPLGIAPDTSRTSDGRLIITWKTDKLLVNQGGNIRYTVRAEVPEQFPQDTRVRIPSRAWASATNESPMSSLCILVVTSDELPPPPPEPTTMYKTANAARYSPDDTVTYTIAYKQTHGFAAASTSSSQWSGSDLGISPNGETISFGAGSVNMYFTPSYGNNVTLTGTIHTVPYENWIYVFARNNNSGSSVEVGFKHEWAGVQVAVSSNGTRLGDTITVDFPNEPAVVNYKIVLRNDSLLFWMGDIDAPIPVETFPGIGTQAGYAGVRYTGSGFGSQRLTNWRTQTDNAYGVTIRDTIPFGIRYIPNSATGQINTGTRAPQQLTGTLSNNVLTWPVVSGTDPLGANDSLTVTWKAIVDTARNRLIVNTAYADIDGYPLDSIGAQVRSRFVLDPNDPDDPDDPDIPDDPNELHVRANPERCIFTKSITVSLTAFMYNKPTNDAKIIYTTNGMTPDPWTPGATREYTVPLEFSTLTTLKAMAVTDDYEESGVITHVYELLRTVPVATAAYFEKDQDGLAHGVRLALDRLRTIEPDVALIWKHIDLIQITGNPEYDFIELSEDGDTLVIFFKGNGMAVPANARVTIREPELPGSAYTAAHGYLAEREINITHNFVPKAAVPEGTIYSIKIGPNPFKRGLSGRDSVKIFIDPNPFPQTLDAKILIYDKLGNVVAASGENIIMTRDEGAKVFVYAWDGTNRRRRYVGNGTYLVHISVKDPINGERKTFRRLIYFVNR